MKTRHLHRQGLAFILLIPGIVLAQQDPPKPMTGTYQIGGNVIPEPPTQKKLASHVRFYLSGKAAADLYKSMPARPVLDQCFDDGTMTKAAGDLLCARSSKGKAECWFGLELKTGKVVPGFVC